MKTCLYLTLLTTLCCTLAHAYPEDNYVFDRSGISYMTEGENTIFCIKGGSVVPMNAASFNNEVGIPEAARENVVKVQAVGGSGGAALRRDGRLAVWGSPFSDLEHGEEDVAYNPVSARHTRTVTNVVDIAALSTAVASGGQVVKVDPVALTNGMICHDLGSPTLYNETLVDGFDLAHGRWYRAGRTGVETSAHHPEHPTDPVASASYSCGADASGIHRSAL